MGIQHVNLYRERIGKIGKNKHGSIMKVVEYNNANDIWVKFSKGKPIHSRWAEFMIGEVKNPYDKLAYGLGFIGEGDYKVTLSGKKTIQHDAWTGMLQRCYDEKFHTKHPTYKNCEVTGEWLNFQNFAKWFDENYYTVSGQSMSLDKDILIKGNKIYRPETCILVPQRINVLFVKSDAIRGDQPIGVYLEKQTGRYKAQCKTDNGVTKNIGRFNTPELAFAAYKSFKENYIKEVAEEYKEKIPKKLYDALHGYIVEITD